MDTTANVINDTLFERKSGRAEKDRLCRHDVNGVVWFSAPVLDRIPGLVNVFSTRLGGVSTGCTGAMNLGFGRGDDPACVRENFRILGKAAGFDLERLVFTQQTHTANILEVSEKDAGNGFARPLPYRDVDALVTNTPGLVLTVFTADCVPVLLADPVHGAAACVHSGWKGTASEICVRTLETMEKLYGTRAEDVSAAIGPSVCRACYEVSEDVAERFAQVFTPAEMKQLCDDKGNGKYQLDLWTACRLQLERTGVNSENISVTDICTRCNAGSMHSHRASGNRRGSLAGFIALPAAF